MANCRRKVKPSDEVRNYWGLREAEMDGFSRGEGCMNCMHTGYKGRSGVYEVLPLTDEIQSLILKRASAQEITTAAVRTGKLTPLKVNALEKVVQKITTFEEAASAVMV